MPFRLSQRWRWSCGESIKWGSVLSSRIDLLLRSHIKGPDATVPNEWYFMHSNDS